MIAVNTDQKRIYVHRDLDSQGGSVVLWALESLFLRNDVLFREPWGFPGPFPFRGIGGQEVWEGRRLVTYIEPLGGWTIESQHAV